MIQTKLRSILLTSFLRLITQPLNRLDNYTNIVLIYHIKK